LDRCCGEAGTFAMARPDISSQVRYRKQTELHNDVYNLTGSKTAKNGNVKLLTSCPACQQGLSRYADDTGLETDYIIVEMISHLQGQDWQNEFVQSIENGGIERVLL